MKYHATLIPGKLIRRHKRFLANVVATGHRALVFFAVMRGEVHQVRPADNIDPVFGGTLREAMGAGVEAVAYAMDITTDGIRPGPALPLILT
ncbi:MAG: DNA/RNA nuclease SfsA [Thermoleophilia bacterium]